jgi:alkyl hydroperoxide reductase subunit AhpF
MQIQKKVQQVRYKLFYTQMCPNCPAVKEFMKTVDMKGEEIDASTKEGLEQARKFNIMAVPKVVFLEDDEIKSEAETIEEIKRVIDNKSLV